MNWLFPAFLAGAAAILLPLLLHFLRRRPVRTQAFPALRFFLGASPAEQRQHRLRRWLVLLLRCGVLALLAMMFARPFLRSTARPAARATVIVIDNSFSLQAAGRWPKLVAWARQEFGQAAPGETVGLLLTSPKPTWLLAPTRNVELAWRTLESHRPGWQASRFAPALMFAADALAAVPATEKRILFLGDHQAAGWNVQDFNRPLRPGIRAAFPDPAPPPGSQAALDAPVVTRDGDMAAVELAIRNFQGTRRRTLSVYVGDALRPAATATFDPATPTGRSVSLRFKVRETDAWVRCALEDDELPADDTAWALIPAPANRSPQAVLLDRVPAGAEADFLATACESFSALTAAPRTGFLPAAPWPALAVAVLRNDGSFAGEPAARLDAFLAGGGSALIFPTGGPAQAKWLAGRQVVPVALAGEARIRDWSVEHPLVAPLAEHGLRSLVGWQFSRGWSLPAAAVEPLAFWSDGTPALGEFSAGKGRVLLAGFSADRRDGNWPVEGAFVPFLHRATSYLLSAPARAADAAPRVGLPITLEDGAGQWRCLSGPAGSTTQAVTGRVVPEFPGIYEWAPAAGMRRLYAVGLAPEESDLAPWPDGTPWKQLAAEDTAPRQLQQRATLMAAQQSEQQGRLWWWCLVAAAAFFLSELALANRTAR
ncbi:MAG TPA: VWA domain-containing protein [Lacunisphaera sp.]|nr:VWA domain-containing protein [Lacunisphaera sp.]